jgi:hypothetical protein
MGNGTIREILAATPRIRIKSEFTHAGTTPSPTVVRRLPSLERTRSLRRERTREGKQEEVEVAAHDDGIPVPLKQRAEAPARVPSVVMQELVVRPVEPQAGRHADQ